MTVAFTLNGRRVRAHAEPQTMLLDVLREEFGLTGPRGTCGMGVCGTCTVLLDGRTASSCILMAGLVADRDVTTIEGVADDDPMVAAFDRHHAYQCGYCIPGMVLTGKAMAAEGACGGREQIREGLGGNLCRCGSYGRIIDAIEEASQ
jgi:aerobic-type carbon monoxide dehydrogenase small subunit (CoxS/CutS family)